ncbi:hypothetical protein RRG08_060025 [Elysia crispata]|uniref:Uncharacterized protein n=1 Tax=Elysia crispata TaxID=231223 RepID=A0AAE0YF05_9GAST|nr:hypothetical protein RRG08_060025 [Elysia crispata]
MTERSNLLHDAVTRTGYKQSHRSAGHQVRSSHWTTGSYGSRESSSKDVVPLGRYMLPAGDELNGEQKLWQWK